MQRDDLFLTIYTHIISRNQRTFEIHSQWISYFMYIFVGVYLAVDHWVYVSNRPVFWPGLPAWFTLACWNLYWLDETLPRKWNQAKEDVLVYRNTKVCRVWDYWLGKHPRRKKNRALECVSQMVKTESAIPDHTGLYTWKVIAAVWIPANTARNWQPD